MDSPIESRSPYHLHASGTRSFTRLPSFEQPCKVWVHDAAFSEEDVLFNATYFPDEFSYEHAMLRVKLQSGEFVPRSIRRAKIKHKELDEGKFDDDSFSDSSSASGPSVNAAQDGPEVFLFAPKELKPDIRNRYQNLQVTVNICSSCSSSCKM